MSTPRRDAPPDLSSYLERLEQVSTAERVAGILRERITEGDFPPGTRLSEERISRALGVSRNSLREGFRLLVRERLVVHQMNRGVFVRVPTATDIEDLFRLRCILETAAVRASAGADLAAVLAAVERGEKAAAEDDWAVVATADLRFHRALTALLRSERVDDLMVTSMAELRLAFHATASAPAFHEPYLRRNRVIVDLLLADSTEPALLELESYLADAQRELLIAVDVDSFAEHRADRGQPVEASGGGVVDRPRRQ